MSAIPTSVIPSSTDQRLTCLAERIHHAGPDVLLQMMRAQLTSSSAMAVFERYGMLTLPAPSRVIDISSRFQPTVRQ